VETATDPARNGSIGYRGNGTESAGYFVKEKIKRKGIELC
jgi:hypothetical protein